MKRKIRKSEWLPWLLLLYAGGMTFYFGPQLKEEGKTVQLWITAAVELLFIIGLFFALRHKEKLQDRRENLLRNNEEKEKG